MLKAKNHIIKKQVLDIYTDAEKDVWKLQNRIRSIYYEKMLPIIEEACNNYDSGEILRIDNLTLDLGEVSSKKLDEQIVRALGETINEQLSKIVFQTKTGSTTDNVRVKEISQNISDLELVTTFLKTGVLPWWKKSMTASEMETIFIQQIQKNAKAIKLFLLRHIGYESVLKRIIYQFSEQLFEKLIVSNAEGKSKITGQLLKELKAIFSQLVKKEKLPSNAMFVFWQELIRISVEEIQHDTNEKFILQKLLDVFEQKGIRSKKVLIKSICRIIRSGNQSKSKKIYGSDLLMAGEILLREIAPKSGIEFINDVENTEGGPTPEKVSADSKDKEVENSDPDKRNQAELESKENFLEKATDKPVLPDETNKQKSEQKNTQKKLIPEFNLETVEEVYIGNAGLVLVWNYLPFYFKHIGLVVDGEFTGEQAKHRAAHLLQYIVTGDESAPEYELPLNKLLCGISLAEPLEKSIHVTEDEKAEAEVMLQTAITHWGALGQSSPLALRQSFLNREGMLTKDHKSWILRVEESAIDILLDKLPWSYSIINFKWMEKPIYVEWR